MVRAARQALEFGQWIATPDVDTAYACADRAAQAPAGHPMPKIQLAVADAAYAAALRERLERSGMAEVYAVEAPDPSQEGVIVMDSAALSRLKAPLEHPERVVLITRNDPGELSRAWNAGIRSVVFCNDPLNTAVLAIMAAALRCGKPGSGTCGGGARPKRATSEQNGRRPKASGDGGLA